jgi:hypothetical protein
LAKAIDQPAIGAYSWTCAQCGTRNTQSDLFCSSCGLGQNEGANHRASASSWEGPAGAALLSAVLGVVAFLVVQGRDDWYGDNRIAVAGIVAAVTLALALLALIAIRLDPSARA